ncbi:MAG: hypothetical protein QE509_02205 [Gammaproteobacteria bacterium]|nr:hypothetical protein [Gammaproteobacteria bacterium]
MATPDDCASFDETDKLVLRYSQSLTRDNLVDDQLYGELAERFSTDELVELCVTVGLSAMVNRVHATFRTDVDDSTEVAVGGLSACMLPPRR